MPRKLDETWQLLDDFAEATRLLQTEGERDEEVLSTLCGLALKILEADHASVTTVRGGRFTTAFATSEIPAAVDEIQYQTGEGPCLDTIEYATTFRVDDLATDARWPRFGTRAAQEGGMRSMLTHVLPVDDQTVAALNLYAVRPQAFTTQQETLIGIVGATATATLRAARRQEQLEHLNRALHTSRRIGVALGIVMATHRVSIDDAWELLAKASQDSNTKVSVLAETVIETGTVPAPDRASPA